MKRAWVARPYPHGKYRVKEFLLKNIIGLGWPLIGDLSHCNNRNDIKKAILSYYNYSSAQSLGQAVGNISRFIFEIQINDYVLLPDGPIIYIGEVTSLYKYDNSVDSDEEGYPHQREISWIYDKKAIPRNLLTGRIYDSLKGQQSIFSTYHSDIDDIVVNKKHYFTKQSFSDLKMEYLNRIQRGVLRNVNSNTFENAVCALYSKFFPGLRRLATTSGEKGDTDLLAILPGEVNVRIQVKHFYFEQGEIQPWVVDQLADSMEVGDHGIIVTSGIISKAAKERAESITDKNITFIDGQEFVEHLFDSIDTMSKDSLDTFGISYNIGFL
jgi:predicted Mrr-cat superfamily restriction endonuclease